MDIDRDDPTDCSLNPVASNLFELSHTDSVTWVQPSTSPSDFVLLVSDFDIQSIPSKVHQFISRWPPSHTPRHYSPWIWAMRPTITNLNHDPSQRPNIEGLQQSFHQLSLSKLVSISTLDEIAKTHNVLIGKWIVFEEPSKINELWEKVVRLVCIDGKAQQAKVSTYDVTRHVICVYVDDYTNMQQVSALREALRSIGVVWKIAFKMDAYTHLGIYKDNEWGINSGRYYE